LLFRGQRGADTLAGWGKVTEASAQTKKKPTRAVDATGYTHLAYIERGKTAALAQIGDEQQRQDQVLATARCFATLIEQLDALSSGGTAQRERIIALGGAQLLTSACRFIRDEDLLLKCVTCIFRLSHDFALRRQLVKVEVRAPEALATVLCRPHISEVVSTCLDTLGLLCLEGDVASTLASHGVLNAICTLCLKVAPDDIPVLFSATTLLTTMSKDRACLRDLNAKGTMLMSAMFRLLRVCLDSSVASMACGALASVCEGHNRIVMGRHKSIGALLLVVERAALETEESAHTSSLQQPRPSHKRPQEHGGGDSVAGTCALISRLSEIKEHRDSLVRMGVIHPLVALVLMSHPDSESAKAAKAAIKTVEVEQVYREQIEQIVDAYVARMSGSASDAGSRSATGTHNSHLQASVATSNRTGGSTKREHWTDRLAGAGRREMPLPDTRVGGIFCRADRDLLLQYLSDQSHQRELALAEEEATGSLVVADDELDGLEDVEEETHLEKHSIVEEEGDGEDDVAFLEGRHPSEPGHFAAGAASRPNTKAPSTARTAKSVANHMSHMSRASHMTHMTRNTAHSEFVCDTPSEPESKPSSTIQSRATSRSSAVTNGLSRPVTGSHSCLSNPARGVTNGAPLTLEHTRPQHAHAHAHVHDLTPPMSTAHASPAPSGTGEDVKTPLSARSTASLSEDAVQLRARLDKLKQDLGKNTQHNNMPSPAPSLEQLEKRHL